MYTVWLIKYSFLYTLNSVVVLTGKGIFSSFWQFVHNFLYIQYRLFNVVASEKLEKFASLKAAHTVLDVFNVLLEENIFSKNDVTFLQLLLKKTDCEELNKKCINYASTNRVCFFESDPGNFLFILKIKLCM